MKNSNANYHYRITRNCKMIFVEKEYIMNLDKIILKKNTPFIINGKKLILNEDKEIDKEEQGFFVLKMWVQCDIADLSIFPADYIVCESLEEKYELFNKNVLLGEAKDICIN